MCTMKKITVIPLCALLLSGCAASTDVTLLGSLQGDGVAEPTAVQTVSADGAPVVAAADSQIVSSPLPPLTPEAAREQTRQDLQALASSRTGPTPAGSAASLQELLDLRDGHADRMSADIEDAARECDELEPGATRPAACN